MDLNARGQLLDAVESLKTAFRLDPMKKRTFEKEFPGVRSLQDFKRLLDS